MSCGYVFNYFHTQISLIGWNKKGALHKVSFVSISVRLNLMVNVNLCWLLVWFGSHLFVRGAFVLHGQSKPEHYFPDEENGIYNFVLCCEAGLWLRAGAGLCWHQLCTGPVIVSSGSELVKGVLIWTINFVVHKSK